MSDMRLDILDLLINQAGMLVMAVAPVTSGYVC
jgi:hypothetical protein